MSQRYFFFSYSCRNIIVGNLWFACNKFPPNKLFRDAAAKQCGGKADEILITSIFEFKDKEDYDSFSMGNGGGKVES
jgi:hypothetical protein